MTTPPANLAAALADRYRIERELGRGGMATVYLAEDLKHKRNVALKVLKPELAAVLGAERFVQEIATTAALQHPHILPLFDSGEAGGFLFYVMPFIDGETLRSKLDRETQLGIDEAVRITTDVADALHYAHQQGVIHRDIKPENILLANGRPMVADFGIALALSAAAGGRMTETGLSLGTPHYMSPEQATAEKEITARSDVYSLGSVLYEMLAGNPPHTGASAQQIIMKIVMEEAAAVTTVRKSVPPNVTAAVAKSLEKLAADRFSSAREFADALTNPAFRTATGPAAEPAAASVSGRRAAVLAMVAILATALAAWGWLRPSADGHELQLARQLTFDGTVEAAALSPDGHWLAYITRNCPGRTCTFTLQVREVDGTQSVQLVTWDHLDADVKWSPDGQRLLFRGSRQSVEGVFLIDRLGGSARRLPALSEAMDFTGDGHPTLLVRHDSLQWLVRYDAGSLGAVDSVAVGSGLQVHDLSVEPRGTRIAIRATAGGHAIFGILGADGRLLDSLGVIGARSTLRWDPAGDALLIFRYGPGISDDLFRVPLRGDRLDFARRQVVLGQVQTGYRGRFDVSQGSRIAVVSAPTTHQMQIIRLDAPRPAWTPFASRTGFIQNAEVSPDGSRILTVATDNLGDNLYLFPIDGSAASPVTAQKVVTAPLWSPDGRRLSYWSLGRGLAVADLDGGGERVIRSSVEEGDLMWLADDSLVTVEDGAFIVWDMLGTKQRTVAPPDSLGDASLQVVLDPASGRVAYVSGKARVLVVGDLRTGRFTRWTSKGETPVGWVDGSLFVMSDGQLARLSGPGRPLSYLVPVPPECGVPSVDRAGRVAVCAGRSTRADVWLADRAGKSGWWE